MTAPQFDDTVRPGHYVQESPAPYGAPQYVVVQPPVANESAGLGIAGMVLGIIGLVFFWVPFLDLLLGVLAVVFGGLSLNSVFKGKAANKSVAVAGLSMGIITVLASLVWIVALASSSR
jgi:hypothetical protein